MVELGLIVATLLTLGIFTLIYKENPVYRFTEHLFVGTAMGYSVVVAYRNIQSLGVAQIAGGNYIYLLPFALGILMYSRYFGKKYSWLSRIPVSLLLGSSIGISMRAIPDVEIYRQLQATFNPIIGAKDMITGINNLVLLLAFIFSLIYFTFTIKLPQKVDSPALKLGRYFLMVYMGALYGNVIIHRASLLVSRFQFILYDVLQLA